MIPPDLGELGDLEWAKRIPFEPDPKTGAEPEIELRRLHELDDFAPGPAVEHRRKVGEQLAQSQRK